MESTIIAPIDAAAEALATAAGRPLTVTGEETLTLVWDLARIAHHLGELTAAVRDRWADWGTVTPHLQRAETLAADATRCLSHAAGTYVFNTAVVDTAQPGTHPSPSTTPPEVHYGRPRSVHH